MRPSRVQKTTCNEGKFTVGVPVYGEQECCPEPPPPSARESEACLRDTLAACRSLAEDVGVILFGYPDACAAKPCCPAPNGLAPLLADRVDDCRALHDKLAEIKGRLERAGPSLSPPRENPMSDGHRASSETPDRKPPQGGSGTSATEALRHERNLRDAKARRDDAELDASLAVRPEFVEVAGRLLRDHAGTWDELAKGPASAANEARKGEDVKKWAEGIAADVGWMND